MPHALAEVDPGKIAEGRIARALMLLLLCEQIDRPLKRFAMDAQVGEKGG